MELTPCLDSIIDHCLVLVGSRNKFEQDFTIKLKLIEVLLEDLNVK